MAHMTQTRKQRLRTLEKEIRNGMEEFYYTGMKLKEIRDDDLYKEGGFETWEEYCRGRWEWSGEHVRRLIIASEYRQKLPTPPSGCDQWSERSIRHLTRIPDTRQAARVAAKVVKAVEKSEQEAAKNPELKPIKLSSSTVKKFVDEDLGIEAKPKEQSKPRDTRPDLADYLRSKAGQIEAITEHLVKVPADAWELLEEDEPGLAERLATVCDALAELLRS